MPSSDTSQAPLGISHKRSLPESVALRQLLRRPGWHSAGRHRSGSDTQVGVGQVKASEKQGTRLAQQHTYILKTNS